MGKRRRIARKRPWLGGSLVAVPYGRDDDDVMRNRVGDRVGLDLRVGVAGSVEWITDPAEAHVDHAGVLVDGPPDRLRLRELWNRPLRGADLRDQQLGRREAPGDADRVVHLGSDDPGDERPVPFPVDPRRSPDEAFRGDDVAHELGMAAVDTGVEDRDANRRERRRLGPGVVGVVRGEVPLAGNERVRWREGSCGDSEGGREGERSDEPPHQAGAATMGIVSSGPGNPEADSRYVVVCVGRTTAANEPSACTVKR